MDGVKTPPKVPNLFDLAIDNWNEVSRLLCDKHKLKSLENYKKQCTDCIRCMFFLNDE